MMAPSAGRFSQGRPSMGGRRQPARSRYVDTFNTGGDDAASGAAPNPLPAAKPKAPAYKVFTPQKVDGQEADEQLAPGAAKPLFMTPTADVYANVHANEAEPVDPAVADAPTQ